MVFPKHIGICNIGAVELWGVFEGFSQLTKSICKDLQIDNTKVFKALTTSSNKMRVRWGLLQKIKVLFDCDWEIHINHTYRESNKCANTLINLGLKHGSDLQLYDVCSLESVQYFFGSNRNLYPRVSRM